MNNTVIHKTRLTKEAQINLLLSLLICITVSRASIQLETSKDPWKKHVTGRRIANLATCTVSFAGVKGAENSITYC